MKKNIKITLWILSILAIWMYVKVFIFIPDEFKDQAHAVQNCPSEMFDKSSIIFDAITICGTKLVSQEKLEHASNVAAVWLDNDRNGNIDEVKLSEVLKNNGATVIMSENGFSWGAMAKVMMNAQGIKLQDLSAQETNNPQRRDASQEEIHHIIMNGWWIPLYPKIFSDQKQEWSDLYKVWKKANDAWYYSYNDPTCDDACKVTEFVYLASAAYLNSSVDLESDEMSLKNKEQMQESIPEVIDIFESEAYIYPTLEWPNGTYKYDKNIVYFWIN